MGGVEVAQRRAPRVDGQKFESLRICGVSETRFGSLVRIEAPNLPKLKSFRFYAPEPIALNECVLRNQVSLRNLSSKEKSFYPPDELKRVVKGPLASLRYSRDQIERKNKKSEPRSYQKSEAWRRAVIEGRVSDLPKDVWQKGQYLGTAHLFVVSGLHIGFLFLVLSFFFSKLLRLRSIIGCVLSAACMLVYVIGFNLGLPAWRAFCFFSVGSLLVQFFPQVRRYPRADLCAFVGVLFFLWNPLWVMTPTYILSFGVSLSLVSANSIRGAPLYASLSAACLCALLGFPSSVLSPLWNLIFVPLFSFFVFPALSAQSLFPIMGGLSEILIFQFSQLIDFAFSISKVFGVFHLSRDAALLLWVGLFFIFKLRLQRERILAISAWVVLAGFSIYLNPGVISKNQLETIDVGQGDGLLIQLEGKNIVIDGGKSVEFERDLRKREVHKVDLWVLTHFDEDHFGAFREISHKFKIQEIWIPRWDSSKSSLFLKRHYRKKVKTSTEEGLVKKFDEFTLKATSFGDKGSRRDVTNKDSLILELYKKDQLLGLFLGDALKAQEHLWLKAQKKELNRPSFLKVGHHGSNTSSSIKLLRSIRPKKALIPVGRGNSYRFPKRTVLDRFENLGATILRTDTQGSFILRLDDL